MSSFAERERGGAFQPIFDEELFKDTVRRERKRTERSGLAMVMLSIGMQDSRRENTSALFAGIADALSVIKSDIDILGWFERRVHHGPDRSRDRNSELGKHLRAA